LGTNAALLLAILPTNPSCAGADQSQKTFTRYESYRPVVNIIFLDIAIPIVKSDTRRSEPMVSKKNIFILPVSIAAAFAALLLAGTGLSSLAQIGSDSTEDQSGTINSLIQQDGEAAYVIGGEWSLSLDGDELSDFSADLVMTKSDGTGSHTHQIVIADDTDTIQLADEQNGTVEVTLTPTEQNVGGTVLVNATGLASESESVVMVNDMIAGNTTSDADGNLLFALGTSDEMVGSSTVTVDDGVNSGSASLSIMASENVTTTESGNLTTTENATSIEPANVTTTENLTSTQPSNLTATENTGNLTDDQSSNATTSQSISNQTDQTIYGTTIQGQSYGSVTTDDGAASNTTVAGDTTDFNADGNLTTFEEEAITAGEVMDNTTGSLTTTTASENTTSTDTESPILATSDGTFEFKADIYSDGELKWEDVSITVTVLNEQVIMIEVDPAATDNHFGGQPIFGMADT
jgi:hypothetical protein